jgi:hypothetical protein
MALLQIHDGFTLAGNTRRHQAPSSCCGLNHQPAGNLLSWRHNCGNAFVLGHSSAVVLVVLGSKKSYSPKNRKYFSQFGDPFQSQIKSFQIGSMELTAKNPDALGAKKST